MFPKLPYEMRDALVQCCGCVFWYRDEYRSFLLAAGVAPEMYDRHGDQSKYKIARLILGELDAQGDDGFLIQRRIVTEFCKLRAVPSVAPDRDAALAALRHLKQLALSQKLYVEEPVGADPELRRKTRNEQKRAVERNALIESLNARFHALLLGSVEEQRRGYDLESILSELFSLSDVPYRRSYRTQTEQIDGHFSFRGFDYLVEARWRKDQPSEADLAGLKLKVDKKITSTRGLFLSVVGFRQVVIDGFTQGVASNIILMDGADLTLVLEGHVSLVQALEFKVEKAAQEGIIHASLRKFLDA